jgi:hypothetical protein
MGGGGHLSKGSKAQFIKITPPPPPAPHTSSEIRLAHSLIISEITEAAIAGPTADTVNAQLVSFNYSSGK